jgi:hypothetical protein
MSWEFGIQLMNESFYSPCQNKDRFNHFLKKEQTQTWNLKIGTLKKPWIDLKLIKTLKIPSDLNHHF